MTARPPHQAPAPDDCLRAATECPNRFGRSLVGRDQVPADTSSQIVELAAVVATLPRALSGDSRTLLTSLAGQHLTLDSMSDEPDAATATLLAVERLDQAAALARGLYTRLDDAHNASAHLVSEA